MAPGTLIPAPAMPVLAHATPAPVTAISAPTCAEPTSIAHAMELKQAAHARIAAIQIEIDASTKRSRERSNALADYANVMREIRFYAAWIKQENIRVHADEFKEREIIIELMKIIDRLADTGIGLSDDEYNACDRAAQYVEIKDQYAEARRKEVDGLRRDAMRLTGEAS